MAKNTPEIEVTIKGEKLEFRTPSKKRWTRYLEKQRNDEARVAKRELVQTCCTNVDPGEVRPILEKAPAAINKIAAALESLARGDVEVEETEDGDLSVKLNGNEYALRRPDIESWEATQERLEDEDTYLHDIFLETCLSLCDEDDALKSDLSKYPGAVMDIFDLVSDAAGGDVEIVAKKD